MLTRGGLEEARAKGVGDTASLGSHVVCCARLNSSCDTIAGNAFGTLTTVSGSLRPQIMVPLRRSGVGRERKPPETCAWEPKPRCRRGSGTSSTGCPAGKTRSGAAAAPSCNQGGTMWLFRKGPTVWGRSPRLRRFLGSKPGFPARLPCSNSDTSQRKVRDSVFLGRENCKTL